MFAKKIFSVLFNKGVFQMDWGKKKSELTFYHAAD